MLNTGERLGEELVKDSVSVGSKLAMGHGMIETNAFFEEKKYREAVQTLLVNRSSQQISNGQPLHAAILFETFFKNAENRLCIFCENLSNLVFGNSNLVEAAKAMISSQQVTLDIVIQAPKPDDGPFCSMLRDHLASPFLHIRRAMESERTVPINFSVMDSRALRFEGDRRQFKAFAIMFAPALAAQLMNQYEEIFHRATPLNF